MVAGRGWGRSSKEACGEPGRLLIRSASVAHTFPQTMSVISLPDRNEAVRKALDAAWDYHRYQSETMEWRIWKREMRRPKVREALDGVSPEEAFQPQIEARRTAAPKPDKSVKQAELETLLASKEEIGWIRQKACFTLARCRSQSGIGRG